MDQATIDRARAAAVTRTIVRLPDKATARERRLRELMALRAPEPGAIVRFPSIPERVEAVPLPRRLRRTRVTKRLPAKRRGRRR